MTDTPFLTWKFGHPVKNVLGFGAVADGATDCRAAIQAAYDYTTAPWSSANRGVIFFPPGRYHLNGAVLLDGVTTFVMRGDSAIISGNFDGYLFDRSASVTPLAGTRVVENLTFEQGYATGGCLRLNDSIGASVRDNTFSGNKCIVVNHGQSNSITGNSCSTGGHSLGSLGISSGENNLIAYNDVNGFDKGILFCGTGAVLLANRHEVNGIAVSIGDSSEGLFAASGYTIWGGSFESNGTALEFQSGSKCGVIGGFTTSGTQGAAPYDRTVVASTTITGTISGATATGSIDNAGTLTLGTVTGTFQPGTDFITGTNVPTGTKLYAQLTGVAGKAGTYSCSGTPSHSIRTNGDATQLTTFEAISAGAQAYTANISVGNTTNRGGIVFKGVIAGATGTLGGAAWSLPSSAHTAQWDNCDVQPTFLYAGLPTGSNARTGDRYVITDSGTASVGNFGATVSAGGGSNTVELMRKGSAWTISG